MSLAERLRHYLNPAPQGECVLVPTLIVQEGCEPCVAAQKELEPEIQEGLVRVLPSDHPDAALLMEQAGVDMYPQAFIVDCEGAVVGTEDLEDPPDAPQDDETAKMEATIVSNIKRFVQ